MAMTIIMGHLADAMHHLPAVTQASLDSLHQGSQHAQGAAKLWLVDDTVTADQLREKLKNVTQESQGGWLVWLATHFIGMFNQGGQVFVGFVSGIIPTLVVLMTAFYALTGLIGEEPMEELQVRPAGVLGLLEGLVELVGGDGDA